MPRQPLLVQDCTSCGACCSTQGTPPFSWYAGDIPPEDLRWNVVFHADRYDRSLPCLWYDVETRTCRHYERRPEACRQFEVGGEDCLWLRGEAGVEKIPEGVTTMRFRVISGGQTGVDQAALRAAKACGIETGGWVPRGWLTEDGPAPWLADYGLEECATSDYPARTKMCVANADAVLWIGNPYSRGGKLTLRLVQEFNIDVYTALPDVSKPLHVAQWWLGQCDGEEGKRTLMVAGNRESKSLGIGAAAEAFLCEVFDLLKEKE
jgi:hypothetical protein